MPCIAPTLPKAEPAAVRDKSAVLKNTRVFTLPGCFVVDGINNDFIVRKEFSCTGYFNKIDQGWNVRIIGGYADVLLFTVSV